MVKLVSQNRRGLFPEHRGVAAPAYAVRATVPVVEALRAAGAGVDPLPLPNIGYTVRLTGTVPAGLVAVHLNGPPPALALRLADEPEYPMEFPDYWGTVAFTPCPMCGAAVVWYEAGYVPGYRVCVRPPHHHALAK
jgi:hypothetical protein